MSPKDSQRHPRGSEVFGNLSIGSGGKFEFG